MRWARIFPMVDLPAPIKPVRYRRLWIWRLRSWFGRYTGLDGLTRLNGGHGLYLGASTGDRSALFGCGAAAAANSRGRWRLPAGCGSGRIAGKTGTVRAEAK